MFPKTQARSASMRPGSEVLAAPYEVRHTMEEILALAAHIQSYGEEVRAILENTGHYHWPIVSLLMEQGIFVACINALRMKKYCAQSLRKRKTDRIDSIKIASYGITYWSELSAVLPRSDIYDELRIFSRQYYQYTSLVVKSKINVGNLLDQVMPGIQNLLADQDGTHKLTDFVLRYGHFNNITNMGRDIFIADYCEWSKRQGYRQNEIKVKDLYALSQNGIPVLPYTSSTKIIVLEAVQSLQELEKSRNIILSHMQQLASTLPEYSTVLAMGGVGKTLAPRLIDELGDVRRFHNGSALIAYAGIDTPPFQSGSFTGTRRSISKRGNKHLRKTGYETMQSVMRKKPSDDPVVYQFIQKNLLEGKRNKAAKIAGSNKFLRIYYARVTEIYRQTDEQVKNTN